ncbi:MAG: carbon-nitrogen hydrolase family protein [Miltoncostaeaceae bacterium]
MTSLRVAAVQLTSSDDAERNARVAGDLVAAAAEAGARLVVLPEKWHYMHEAARMADGAEALDGPSLSAAQGWARQHGVALVAGSAVERVDGDRRTYNTSVLIQPDGEVGAVYRKIHLFDVEVGGTVYRESDGAFPGERPVVGQALGLSIGMSVCYDLRFPELYRSYADHGVEIISVPAAFTAMTGRDHWEPLLRARAIENQAFVIAADQVGVHPDGTRSHGRSMVVDPWGVVLAQAPDTECFVVADLDLKRLDEVRATLPALTHRRPDVYESVSRSSAGSAGPA